MSALPSRDRSAASAQAPARCAPRPMPTSRTARVEACPSTVAAATPSDAASTLR
ncbi:protein of unassigned function [Methylobacterium oryzae CBMB20]|uniref:Protein of unassigned function n=1 Tax=Methylobacterium oryzae CBMB20 TaxID=693986 RepID=A0A089NMJ7_9HYPH|nr:protein of unassigned function [Methylobacterium oryzae CBMB20]